MIVETQKHRKKWRTILKSEYLGKSKWWFFSIKIIIRYAWKHINLKYVTLVMVKVEGG